STVFRIDYDARRNKVTGASYFDAQGRTHQVQARLVIVAAHAIETPRLLLLSANNTFPEGLGNSSGLVGKNFMAHPTCTMTGLFHEPLNGFKGPVMGDLLVQDWYETDGRRGFARGYTLEKFMPSPFFYASNMMNLWGAELKEMIRYYAYAGGWWVCGEGLPNDDNTVTLDPDIKDKYDLSVAHLKHGWTANDRCLIQHGIQQARDILAAAGAWQVRAGPVSSAHPMGTVRMGHDPQTSVVNPFCQSHDIPNLFVADTSVFPTGGGANITLTAMAITLRSITHSITASQEVVYRVLADMEAYPEFINDLIAVTREEDLYKFTARVALLTVSATLKVMEQPGHSLAFELVEGPIDAMSGSWVVEAGRTPELTRVTLTVHAETHARGEWLLRMTGKFVQSKTDKLIAAFSQRAEVLQSSGGVPAGQSKTTKTGGFVAWLKRVWARLQSHPAAPRPAQTSPVARPAVTFLQDEHSLQTLEALAGTMIPPDDFDAGVQDSGFVSVVEMRARYEADKAELYETALRAVDRMAQDMFNRPDFVALTPAERTALLEAVRQNQVNSQVWGQMKPATFFSALWEDVVFLYCTHPDTWQRIGFPGPSFETGGYRDFDQPQQFVGQASQVDAY
ncbi:MAG: gluconate 2-dehydrogenase subunit 3 family protein, partial [Chloroflexi bacterium]|nr:gluconate 2-dehydrogenase subunit 3 family protein [Chloroflexota bacterium]